MKCSDQELMDLARLRGNTILPMFQRMLAETCAVQKDLKDEVALRWNQGKQQLLFDMIDAIETARDRLEKPSRQPSTNQF